MFGNIAHLVLRAAPLQLVPCGLKAGAECSRNWQKCVYSTECVNYGSVNSNAHVNLKGHVPIPWIQPAKSRLVFPGVAAL